MLGSHKNPKLRLDLLSEINRLLTLERGIGGEICHPIHLYAKANNK